MYLIDVVERFDMYDLMYIHFSLSLSLSLFVQTQLLASTLMLRQMSRSGLTLVMMVSLPTLEPATAI